MKKFSIAFYKKRQENCIVFKKLKRDEYQGYTIIESNSCKISNFVFLHY